MKPAAVGLVRPAMLSWYVAGCGGKPGDAIGFPENDPSPGEVKGFTNVPVGDRGSLRLRGVGPFGNSHWVDCVGR